MRDQPRVAVVGSTNVDLVTFTDQFPRPGETIFGSEFHLLFGGKGANQAVAASLCGADVQMVGRVGNDLFGSAAIENLQSLGVDTQHVRIVEGVSSGVAPIFVDSSGENRIIVVKGANDSLRPEDIDEAAPVLEQADFIVLQFEIPLETVHHTIRFARSHGIRCILNPAPGQPIDLEEVASVDFLIPNETEAATITNIPVHSVDEAKTCAGFLLDQGISDVMITLGAAGVLAAGPAGMELIPSFKVDVKDTTGAGDAFVGSLATFLGEGMPVGNATRKACLYAALSTTRVGTQTSFVERSHFDREWGRRMQSS